LAHLKEHGFVIITDFVNSPWIPVLREAGRRVTEACSPRHGYGKIDCSKGYVHRTEDDEPWAIRGLIHPAFGEPIFAEFHGSEEFLRFVASWCNGLGPEDLVMSGMLLWCNPRNKEHVLSWHRDVTWWGTGKPYFAQREVRGEGPEAYSEEIERKRWEEIRVNNAKAIVERNGVSMFLALVDDECHELVPGSHDRWRTPLEHDVLLPKAMKEQGVPYTPSWNGVDPLPDQVAVRLKAGEALIRNGATIHTGHTVPERERNTLSIGWSRWSGSSAEEPSVADARHAWQLDPAVREALPYEWMKTAWDRWAQTQKLGDTLEDRYAPYDINRIKAGEVVGRRGELEHQAAAAGAAWKPYQKVDYA
jgi:ectoine hydroxylase-related dioxygenase (phytanoyl-CoA dioxygenase family)